MISEDDNHIFAAFQVVISRLKNFKNSHKVLMISYVVSYRNNHFFE